MIASNYTGGLHEEVKAHACNLWVGGGMLVNGEM